MEDKTITGLTEKEVQEKITQGKINSVKIVCGKTYFQIFKDNVLTFFNILLFVIAGLMIFAGYFDSLFFLVVLLCNIIIGLYEDIHARRLMDKMKIDIDPNAVVIRDGKKITIPASQLVGGDVVIFSLGDKICADGVVLDGFLTVNESLLTGETDDVNKNSGDLVYSGTYVTSGSAYIKITAVGLESYSNKLSSTAKKFKRSKSVILKSLKSLFRVIGGTVIVIAASTLIVYAIQGHFDSVEAFKEAIGPISGSMVGMIPSGLYLLTSTALAVAVISLYRKKANVQDFYSVEMLARTTTLCIDKTGTITDGTMTVEKLITLNHDEEQIKQVLSDLLKATGDKNATANALIKEFNLEPYNKVKDVIPFNSANKYSAVQFENGSTYVLGAPEYIPLVNQSEIEEQIKSYTNEGYRVLILANNTSQFKEGKIDGKFNAFAIIVLKDNLKPNVKETLAWFKDNGVKIKVISGDNALTVSKIASFAGLENAEDYISLEGKNDEEVAALATKYCVFGRVTPNQKRILVEALKASGETVAMTGDGVNDILALKSADCSIAMASGADSAKDSSHIVLMNNDFASLPSVVNEGRRVINNLQRTCSLFLVKTSFTVFFSIVFLLCSIILSNPSIRFPFLTNNMYLWEFASIGMSSFFLALQPNSEQIRGSFMKNIIIKAAPAAITIILASSVPFILYLINTNLGVYLQIDSIAKAAQMASIAFTIVGMIVLLRVCFPLDKYRAIVFGCSTIVNVGGLFLCIIFSLNNVGWNFLKIDFVEFSPLNWLTIALISFSSVACYIIYNYFVSVFKKSNDPIKEVKE